MSFTCYFDIKSLFTNFVGYFESILFKNIDKPLNYFRYVDDIFISNKKDYNVEDLFNKNVIFSNIIWSKI